MQVVYSLHKTAKWAWISLIGFLYYLLMVVKRKSSEVGWLVLMDIYHDSWCTLLREERGVLIGLEMELTSISRSSSYASLSDMRCRSPPKYSAFVPLITQRYPSRAPGCLPVIFASVLLRLLAFKCSWFTASYLCERLHCASMLSELFIDWWIGTGESSALRFSVSVVWN